MIARIRMALFRYHVMAISRLIKKLSVEQIRSVEVKGATVEERYQAAGDASDEGY